MNTARTLKTQTVEAAIGYVFDDKDLIWEALNLAGSGIMHAGRRVFDKGNQKLAIIGDRMADVALAVEWYGKGHSKASFTRAQQGTTSDKNFAAVGRALKLDECLNHHPRNPTALSEGVMATLLEAILGAVYLDSSHNLEQLQEVMHFMGLDYTSGLGAGSMVMFHNPQSVLPLIEHAKHAIR